VLEAIAADDKLSRGQKQALIEVYASFVSGEEEET
jgi:hypothetical protein